MQSVNALENWVPSGFSGYIWLDTKIVFKKKKKKKKISHSEAPNRILIITSPLTNEMVEK